MSAEHTSALVADLRRVLGDIVIEGIDVRNRLPSPPKDARAARRLLAPELATAREECLQLALSALGVQGAVGRANSGEPLWPDGVVGSISHKAVLVLVAVSSTGHFRSIGVDVDRADVADGALRTLVGAEGLPPGLPSGLGVACAHAAKEAVFKAQFPLTGNMLAFDDVVLEWANKLTFVAKVRGAASLEIKGGVVRQHSWVGAIVGVSPTLRQQS